MPLNRLLKRNARKVKKVFDEKNKRKKKAQKKKLRHGFLPKGKNTR